MAKKPKSKPFRRSPQGGPSSAPAQGRSGEWQVRLEGFLKKAGKAEFEHHRAAGLFALFTLMLLWKPLTRPSMVPGGYDMVTAIPYKSLWFESLLRLHPILWNPYSSLGQPFVALESPGAYAPLNFLLFIHPISYAFTWMHIFHFLSAAFFTYLFLRGLGCGWVSGCLGALAFAFSGFFMGHYFWTHPNLIWGASWMPLLLYGLQRFTEKRDFAGLFIASLALGLSILEGAPQMDMYALIAGGFWLAWAWIGRKINWKELCGALACLLFLSFSIGLCQLAPGYQFAHLSSRWFWEWGDIMKDVFRPEYFRFFIDPFFLGGPGHGDYRGQWGFQEVVAYVGLLPLFLALGGFLWLMKRKPLVWWFALLGLLGCILGMADSTTPTHYIYLFFYKFIPGFGHNRSVARIMLLAEFSLACLAALGLENWIDFWKGKRLPDPFRKALTTWVPAAVLVFSAADLYHFGCYNTAVGVDYRQYWDPGMFIGAGILKDIQDDPTYPRIQPETTADSDYEMIYKVSAVMTGYPTQIQTTAKYLAEQWRYSETPLPDLLHLTYRWRPPDFTATERWQPLPGYKSFWTDTKAFPRAFMVGGYQSDPDYNQAIYDIRDGKVDPHEQVILGQDPPDRPNWPKGWVGEAKITKYDWNELEMDCTNDRPCFLVLSDSFYPGWRARVDGQPTTIYQANGALRAVELPQTGHHSVEMSYYPGIITYSFAYSLLAWVVLALAWIFRKGLARRYSDLFRGKLIFAGFVNHFETPPSRKAASGRRGKGKK